MTDEERIEGLAAEIATLRYLVCMVLSDVVVSQENPREFLFNFIESSVGLIHSGEEQHTERELRILHGVETNLRAFVPPIENRITRLELEETVAGTQQKA